MSTNLLPALWELVVVFIIVLTVLLSTGYFSSHPSSSLQVQSISSQLPPPAVVSYPPDKKFHLPNIFYFRIPGGPASSAFRFASIDLVQHAFRRYITNQRLTAESEEIWRKQVRTFPGRRLDVYTGEIDTFHSYMLQSQYWTLGKKPLFLTVLQKPSLQLFTQFHNWKNECGFSPDCNTEMGFLAFVDKYCNGYFCTPVSSKLKLELAVKPVREVVLGFDLVLIQERLEESLALLSLQFGFPMQFLLAMTALSPIGDPMTLEPEFVAFERKNHPSIALDNEFYWAAELRLQEMIDSLNSEQQKLFDSLMSLQKKFRDSCFAPCLDDQELSRQSPECEACMNAILEVNEE